MDKARESKRIKGRGCGVPWGVGTFKPWTPQRMLSPRPLVEERKRSAAAQVMKGPEIFIHLQINRGHDKITHSCLWLLMTQSLHSLRPSLRQLLVRTGNKRTSNFLTRSCKERSCHWKMLYAMCSVICFLVCCFIFVHSDITGLAELKAQTAQLQTGSRRAPSISYSLG